MELVIIGIGLLVFLAHLFTALFEKTRVPDVLPLVFLGLLLGPILGLISPAAFGKAGGVLTTLSLVIILFEGGLGLNFSTLRASAGPGARLTVASFVLTTAAVAPLAVALQGLSWLEGLMLGAILGGTSSAVVIPLIERYPLEERSRTILFLESAFSDVLCIVVTLALLQSIRYNELRPGLMMGQILASFTLASLIGAAGAVFWSTVLDRVRQLENSMFTTPAFVCIIFGVAETLGYSGAIASLAFGVVLGNIDLLASMSFAAASPLARLRPLRLNDAEKDLFAELVFLLKTFFFVYIGLAIQFNRWTIGLTGLFITIIVFAMRLPVVRIALAPGTSRFDASLAAVMVPKGLAAAVLASLPLQAGLARGGDIQDLVYAAILFSILATTTLTFLLERDRLPKLYDYALSPFLPRPPHPPTP